MGFFNRFSCVSRDRLCFPLPLENKGTSFTNEAQKEAQNMVRKNSSMFGL